MTKTLRQGFVWTTTHSKLVFGAFAAFIVIGLVASVANYMSDKKEVTQQEKYFLLEKSYTDKKRGFEEAARAEAQALVKKDKKDAKAPDLSKKATGDIQTDYGSIIAEFDAFIAQDPSTKAAQMAALNLSDVYQSYKKNNEALAALQKVEKSLKKDGVLSALVWMKTGNILADNNDCKGAVEKWQTLTTNKNFSFAHDEAKLRMGICFESMNDLAKAEELYNEVAKKQGQETADFAAVQEAQKYLRLLKVKKNL